MSSVDLIKVWWHGAFSFPAVSMLLSNNGLMEQLQSVLAAASSSSSAPSLSPSACPPPALLCCSHLLMSSLITLQRVHSAQVQAHHRSYHNYRRKLPTVKAASRAGHRTCCKVEHRFRCEHRIQNTNWIQCVIQWRGRIKQYTFFSALCSHRGDNTFLLAMRFFGPHLVILILPSTRWLFLSVSPLFKVHKSISWSLDAAVQRLFVQKRNTDNLLLGNKFSIWAYFIFLKDFCPSRQQMPKQFISNLNAVFVASAYNPGVLQWFSTILSFCPQLLFSLFPI